MNNNDRINLIHRISELEGLTDHERSALLGLLRESKTYGLVWEDKPEAVEERMQEELPVLREVPERALISDSKDAPNHILIEGDNLEALTTLAYTHAGRIDVIYIDPPYNTGNKDFVYNDSFVDREDTYRHSKWLSFMSRRLRIAKQLLSDKGVIFISIDDNEQAQLKLLCDEVFCGLDFVATIPWRKRTAKADVPHFLSQDYEWVLCYANTDFAAGIQKESRKYYETDDFPGKPWRVHDLTKQTSAVERPNSYFTIINPKNGKQYPANYNRTWAITEDTFKEYYSKNRIVFPGDYDFLKISKPVLRYWKEDDEAKSGERFGFTTVSSYINENVGMTQDGTKDITNIFGEKAFGFPKPLSLIKFLLRISNPHFKTLTILDFFAGSGTTLHATMQLNAEDGGHRQCILVTNNENGICENVTYERNKRVIRGYTTPKGEQVAGLTGNTLRYYKTDFVSRTRSVQNMRRLVNLSTDMLCIKEDLYVEQPTFCGERTYKNIFRYFSDGQKRMLVIYREEAIDRLVELIYGMDVTDKIKIYVFSPSEDPWEDSFEDVSDKVELCALPAAIYNAYRRILPKKKDAAATPEEDDAATHKAENPVNGMLNFTDEGDEA